VFWVWVSDSIPRKATFVVMFVLQSCCSGFSPAWPPHSAHDIAFVILMGYGGGFGTMPALTAILRIQECRAIYG